MYSKTARKRICSIHGCGNHNTNYYSMRTVYGVSAPICDECVKAMYALVISASTKKAEPKQTVEEEDEIKELPKEEKKEKRKYERKQ